MKLLTIVKWALILLAVGAASVFAFPFLVACLWLAPYESRAALDAVGPALSRECAIDFTRARRKATGIEGIMWGVLGVSILMVYIWVQVR